MYYVYICHNIFECGILLDLYDTVVVFHIIVARVNPGMIENGDGYLGHFGDFNTWPKGSWYPLAN